MTTVSFVNKKCFVCGTKGRQAEVGIRGTIEPCDLDTRPSVTTRSSIYMCIQRCSSCGYCAPDISTGFEGTKEIVARTQYRHTLSNHTYPDVLNAFVCWSMIQESCGEYAGAGWAALNAAWICDDDAHVRDYAPKWRKEALRLFSMAQSKEQRFGSSESQQGLILIDLLRRTKQFDEAKGLCEQCLLKEKNEKMKRILEVEEDLINEQDARKHTLSEASEDSS